MDWVDAYNDGFNKGVLIGFLIGTFGTILSLWGLYYVGTL